MGPKMLLDKGRERDDGLTREGCDGVKSTTACAAGHGGTCLLSSLPRKKKNYLFSPPGCEPLWSLPCHPRTTKSNKHFWLQWKMCLTLLRAGTFRYII